MANHFGGTGVATLTVNEVAAGFTAGSVLFASGAGAATEDANLNYDTATDVLSLGNTLALTGVAFASLPAAPAAGMLAYVNNSNTATWGATIAGGGANAVLAFYNGANWTVAGK